jgi:hypothetical protein
LIGMKKDTSKATAASNIVRRHKANVKLAERLTAEGWTTIAPLEADMPPAESPRVEARYAFATYQHAVDADPNEARVALVDQSGKTLVTLTSDQAREVAYWLITRAGSVDVVRAIASAAPEETPASAIAEIARKSTMEALRDKYDPR